METLETLETHTMVESWLSSIDGQTAADGSVGASGWKAASSAPPSPPQSRRRSVTPPDLHHYRGRKRKRTMSEPSIISQRPILTPKGPSTQRSRSQSPTRNLRTLLAAATPAIHCKQVSETILPEYVSKLKRNLLQAGEKGVIAEQLKDQLKVVALNEFDDIDKSCFDTGCKIPTVELDSLWASVKDIHKAAETCQRYQKDENAWVQVVRTVLDTVKLHSNLDMLEVNSIQTQNIDPQYLPTLANSPTPFHKKADVALCFTPDHAEVAKLRNKMGGTTLSQMTDPYTKIIPMACGIEVKGSGGNRDEAIVQYGVWAAAGLAKVEELFDGATLLQPLLGWTVVGHDWMLHMSWKLEDGEVVVCGPWRKLDAGTDTYEGIFKLLHLIAQVGQWLQGDYWTWFSDGVVVAE